MERRLAMTEERVTINILNWLEHNGWKIICHDFPQSGTGTLLHKNTDKNRTEKNKWGIIPDILATRNSIALFFENKDRFVLSDFRKLKEIKETGNYSNSLNTIFAAHTVTSIFYGIGIPENDKYINKSLQHIDAIDFLVSTNEAGVVYINYNKYDILP